MKAYIFKKYGAPDKVLALKEVERPFPGAHEVLIKVHATAINDYDWCMITGKPYSYRPLFGLFNPKAKLHTPGMEVAGTVVDVGSAVKRFNVGNAVYGDTSEYSFGSFAEYMCVNEKALAPIPKDMSFEQAASIPHASMLALQGLRDIGQIQDGQNILINGAGGGVGTFGFQLAKIHHAVVTGVDTGEKLKMMRQLGFNHIIDYKQEDFTKSGQRYDLILDCKTNRSPFTYLRALKPHGKYVTVGGQTRNLLQLLFLKPIISLFSHKKMYIVTLKANKDLEYVNQLFSKGHLKCVIDGPHGFEKLPWAIQYFGEGRHQGKVVITMTHDVTQHQLSSKAN